MATGIITLGGNNILDAIVAEKVKEVARAREVLSLLEIKRRLNANRISARDFFNALTTAAGMALIAEVKPASPTEGDINTQVDIVAQARAYEAGGASVISVLTDAHFKGELEFIQKIKVATAIPVLRKDFIFNPYQIYESRYYGADALLLIAEVLTAERLRELIALTHELGMECLVEAHTKENLQKAIAAGASVVGINARDLRTFVVDLTTIEQLAPLVPADTILVAESGINTRSDVRRLAALGAKAILVGTALMRVQNVAEKIKELKLA